VPPKKDKGILDSIAGMFPFASKNQVVIGLAALVIILAGIAAYLVFFNDSAGNPMLADGDGKVPVQITSWDRTLGSPKAPILVVEYAAPSCPVCANFNAHVFSQFKEKYIDTGKVYYAFRVFMLRASDGAAEAMARCLPADNYFAFIDLMFRNQPIWDEEYGVTDQHAGLVQMGHRAGMSTERIDQCIADPAMGATINKVASDGQTNYHITGTPTFIINGVVQPAGGIPWADLQQKLDLLLSKK
jgi:protein-disulfide isomerase